MKGLPIGFQKLKYYGWHKEYGFLILILVTLRLIWRLNNINPSLPMSMPAWQRFAAHAVHYAFYFFLFTMPLSGWLISSAAGLPVSFFGLFVLPDLVAPNENLRLLFQQIHFWLGWGLVITIIGHTGAALQHHFIHKDDILKRMLP